MLEAISLKEFRVFNLESDRIHRLLAPYLGNSIISTQIVGVEITTSLDNKDFNLIKVLLKWLVLK